MIREDYGILPSDALFPQEGRIACQGVKGAYSQIAAERMFPKGSLVFFKTFNAVFEAVKGGMCDYGIVPIENNSYGSVRGVYEELRKNEITIIRGERILVSHELLAKPGAKLSDIRAIYSHEQALGQCSRFLKELEPKVRIVPCLNTAVAARSVSEMEGNEAAAIASPACAALYGLKPLPVRPADSENNYTRFVCISAKRSVYPGANRLSLILQLAHKPGSLYEALRRFAELELNLTKLESAPIVGRNFEFLFYIDVEASVTEERVRKLLDGLSDVCVDCVYLGNYAEV